VAEDPGSRVAAEGRRRITDPLVRTVARLPVKVRTKLVLRKYKTEMSTPQAKHDLDLLASLSHSTDFSVGCYCEDERHCHRSILRELLAERGATIR